MRVLFGSVTYPLANGVTSSIEKSLDGFKQAGHEVAIISPDYDKGKHRPEHYPVNSSKLMQAFVYFFGRKERVFGFGAGAQIKKIIAHFKTDIYWLHTVTYTSNTLERQMLRSNKPVILTYHTLLEYYGNIYLGALGAQAMILRSAEVANAVDHVITPSQFMRKKLLEYGVKKPISVIPTGIDPPATNGYSKAELLKKYQLVPETELLLVVGRVVEEKNLPFLFKVLAELKKTRPHIHLLLIGPGELDQMKEKANDAGVADCTTFTGGIAYDESCRHYAAADLFVFASQSETQGLVVGEAMSYGLPVVALESPIQPEFYPDSAAAVVKADVEFVAKVAELLDDSKLRRQLGQAGQEFVQKNFSVEKMISSQIELLEKVLKDSRGSWSS